MTLSTVSIAIQTGASTGGMMSEIRTWLDHNKIEPASFKQVDSAFEIGFSRDEEAEFFKNSFRHSN